MENIASDIFHGCFVVICTLLSFIGLVWLREQILHGGGPEWLERDNNAAVAVAHVAMAAAQAAGNAAAGPQAPPEAAGPAAGGMAAAADDLQQGADDEADGPLDRLLPQLPTAEDDREMDGPPAPQLDGVAPGVAAGVAAGAGAAADEINWNPMDWERGPEEITWERLLGLDGSLVSCSVFKKKIIKYALIDKLADFCLWNNRLRSFVIRKGLVLTLSSQQRTN